MSKAEKRVAIAEDVLAQIKAKRLKPKQGEYLKSSDNASWEDDLDDVQFGALIAGRQCSACALGSLFVAKVDNADDITVSEVGNGCGLRTGYFHRSTITEYLEDVFSHDQLDDIEYAFEVGAVSLQKYDEAISPAIIDKGKRLLEFGKGYKSASARLVAIMENIVENNGLFRV